MSDEADWDPQHHENRAAKDDHGCHETAHMAIDRQMDHLQNQNVVDFNVPQESSYVHDSRLNKFSVK